MNLKAWISAAVGMVIGALIWVAIVADVHIVERGKVTISEWCLNFGRNHPWFPLLLSSTSVCIVVTLLTHLWWPRDDPKPSMPMLIGVQVGAALGMYLGVYHFQQPR